MATKLPYVLPFEDGSVVAAILLKAQGLPDAEQIATKTELQQATAYLATLDSSTMAPQSAAVKHETDNLQAQINNIVRAPESGGDVAAEVYQARVGADGVTYPTLKSRIDTEVNLLFDSVDTLSEQLYEASERTFSVSDKDTTPENPYYFLRFPMKAGNSYTVTASPSCLLYLRAEKYLKPSIQTVGGVSAQPVTFTAQADLTWCVIHSTITGDETFTFTIKSDTGLVSTLAETVSELSSETEENRTQLETVTENMNQFINPTSTSFDAAQFEVNARSSYGEIRSSDTRATNKNTGYLSGCTVIPDSEVKMFFYDSNNGYHGWYTKQFELSSELSYDVVLAYQDDRVITDLEELLSHFEVQSEFSKKAVMIDEAIAVANAAKPYFVEVTPDYSWIQGNLSAGSSQDYPGGRLVSSDTRISTSNYNAIPVDRDVSVNVTSGMAVRILFYESLSETSTIYTSAQKVWHEDAYYHETAPESANYYRLSAKYTDDSPIVPAGGSGISTDTSEPFINEMVHTVSRLNELALQSYQGKKVSILGDSISTFEGYTYPGNRCRYPQANLLTDVNDTYWMRLIHDFDLILGINESWAGSRVSWDGTTESQDVGANKHIASATRISHLDENGTPDIIIVNGGTNDIGANVTIGTFNTENPINYTDEQIATLPVATFADAYRTLLIRLQKKYPTANIMVLLPNYTTSYYSATKADDYCEIIKEACDYFGVKWIDMRASGITIFNRASYLPDGIHYNAAGMEIIANNIAKFMAFNFTTI